jgi:hypothetical protein
MKLERKLLLDALSACMPGIESGNPVLEGADAFNFDGEYVRSYNDVIGVSVPLPKIESGLVEKTESLRGTVKASELYRLISKFQGGEVEIDAVEDRWKFAAGRARAELMLMESSLMEKITDLHAKIDWLPTPEDFTTAISMCSFSANKSALSGIRVYQNHVLSTDELRINRFQLSVSMDKGFWISDAAVRELSKLGSVDAFAVAENWVHFHSEKTGAIFSAKRLHDAQYPTEKILAVCDKLAYATGDFRHQLPRALPEAAERASTLAMEMDSHDVVKLTLLPEGVEVSAQKNIGSYQELVAWDDPLTEPIAPVELYVDQAMISHGLKRSSSMYLKQEEKRGKIHYRLGFEGDRILHIVDTFLNIKPGG